MCQAFFSDILSPPLLISLHFIITCRHIAVTLRRGKSRTILTKQKAAEVWRLLPV
ncbi:hypothetical protein HMPREF3213_00865 [Heyndrickxia coagulans]|uniref:Uncharacterized protein n=1 Tax=Heyndrickxia coagulans TaxID=1398 RepID=A0A133KY48_HEYCO|nr:hypothetical protein HMPREF3213_00865 [Heyndrickxia coagulans]